MSLPLVIQMCRWERFSALKMFNVVASTCPVTRRIIGVCIGVIMTGVIIAFDKWHSNYI
jgi:hypothetical protein